MPQGGAVSLNQEFFLHRFFERYSATSSFNFMRNNGEQSLVSIVMPVYNAGNFLMEAVESLQGQTYKNWELITIDDCSSDNSLEILRSFAKKDKRIKVFQNKKREGPSATANYALSKVKGDYIARMDADDVCLSNRLEKQLRFLQKHQEIVAVGGQCNLIDEDNNKIGEKRFPTDSDRVEKMIFSSIPLQQPTLMVNRKLLPNKFTWYNSHLDVAEEVELLFKLFKYGKVCNLSDIVLQYRLHGENTSLKEPKKTFFLTLKTRFMAIYKYGYRPTFVGFITSLVQLVVVGLLPKGLVYPVYVFVRGIKNSSIYGNFVPRLASARLGN